MSSASPSCPMCRADTSRFVRAVGSPFIRARAFPLFRCATCGSSFFEVAMEWEELSSHYDDHARSTSPPSPFRRDHYNALIWRRILRDTKVPDNATVFDVGCKFGDFLLNAPPSFRSKGLELSPHAASIARERGLDVKESSLEAMSRSETFDIVSCLAVLEHLRDPREALATLCSLVNPGGRLALLLPSPETLKAFLWTRSPWGWHMHSPPQHLNFPSRHWLRSMLAEHGFKVSHEFFTHGGMTDPLPPRSLPGKVYNRAARIWNESPLARIPLFDHWYILADRVHGSTP